MKWLHGNFFINGPVTTTYTGHCRRTTLSNGVCMCVCCVWVYIHIHIHLYRPLSEDDSLERCVYLEGLGPDVTIEQIHLLVSKWGKPSFTGIPRHKNPAGGGREGGKAKGYAFVEFVSKHVAETCAAQMRAEKTSFQGAELRVMMKREWEASKRTFRSQQQQLSSSSKYAAAAASASRSTVYIYMFMCLYVYMFVFLYLCMYVCTFICIYVYVCMCIYMYICTCMYVRLYVYMHI